MAGNNKISVRKVLQVFFTLVVTIGCIVAITSASRIDESKLLADVKIEIQSSKLYQFVEEKKVKDEAITNRGIDVEHTPIARLDIAEMERVLEADPWIAHASLFVDNKRVLHMDIAQRVPVARLFMQDGTSCYMDKTLSLMPDTLDFNFYACVVTNVPPLRKDSASTALKNNIWALLKTIQTDTFWNAQISQVIVDSGNTFDLIPVIGSHRIVFGDTSRMKEKFSNLFAFYNKVLNRIGWDRYDVLDVRFRDQIVASPELQYTMPESKNAMNWDWINAYVTQEKKKDSSNLIEEAKPRYERPEIKKKVAETSKKETRKEGKKEATKEIRIQTLGGKSTSKPEVKEKAKEKTKTKEKEKTKPVQKPKEKDAGKPKNASSPTKEKKEKSK